MKRVILPHISDLIERIKYFVYIPEGAESIYCSDDTDEADVEFYLSLPNDKFIQIPEDELQRITDIDVIKRAARLCKEKLSYEQLSRAKEAFKLPYKIDDADVKKILDMFKQCNRIYYGTKPYYKLNDFKNEYDLSDQDLLNIIHSLEVTDYINSTDDIVYNYLGDRLIIFKKRGLHLNNGFVVDIVIYVKLDIDASTGDTVAALSIHEDE